MTTAHCAFRRAALLGALGAPLLGCSYGVFQTAHTEPPGCVSGHVGFTKVFNELEAGRDGETTLGLEPGLRVGLTRQLDVGLAALHLSGAQLDAKYNLFAPDAPLAVAPRFGLGYASNYETWMARAGLLASHQLGPQKLEPYVGVAFANYWVGAYEGEFDGPLEDSRVEGTGSGDGLLEATLGLQFPLGRRTALLVEFSHWFRMQNDPGDDYAFVPTSVFGIALRF